MARFATGIYNPKNPEKYAGNTPPKFRSGWELQVMTTFDNNPNVLQWASEAIRIPYRHPVDGKIHMYIPDFFVVYQNSKGEQITEMIEVKPANQSRVIEGKRKSKYSAARAAIVAINQAKWASAAAYCRQQGITFRVVTEENLFFNGRGNK